MLTAIERAGYTPGEQVAIALDPATTELYADGRYVLAREGRNLTGDEMVEFWTDWVERYPIVSLEDGLAEDDWEGWTALTSRLGGRVQLVGDDLLVTNTERLERAIRERCAQRDPGQAEPDRNADRDGRGGRDGPARRLESDHLPSLRRDGGHVRSPIWRSRPNAGQIKTGSISRSERIAKYNRLLRIEEELGDAADYPGASAFASR